MCEYNPHARFVHERQSVYNLSLATGGTATLSLECALDDLPGQAAFDLPSIATTEQDPAATASKTDATLVVRGIHAGTTTVAITSSDGATSYGSIAITVAPVDHLVFGGSYDEIPPNVDVAFAKEFGTLEEVMLATSTGVVLADDDMVVTPPAGATLTSIRPGVIDIKATPVGAQVIEVESGGAMYSTPFVVVDHADAIALVDPNATIPASGSATDTCFAATAGARFVTGLRWSFDVEGAMSGAGNCGPFSQGEDANHDGMLAITATAGGASAQVSVPIH